MGSSGRIITSADILDGAIMNADVNAAANIVVSKLLHVGAGNVIKSNGTSANVAGQIVAADVTVGSFPSKIQEAILTVNTTVVSFTSIPSTYRHLEIRGRGRSTMAASTDLAILTLNGDTSASYYGEILTVSGTATPGASEYTGTNNAIVGVLPAASTSSNLVGSFQITLPGYAEVGLLKTLIGQSQTSLALSAGNQQQRQSAYIWNNGLAITRVDLATSGAANWMPGTQISLYGWN